MNTVVLKSLSIGYAQKGNEKVVAEGLNAAINSGELTCLLGCNGVGKSTLLRTLSAFQPALAQRIDAQNWMSAATKAAAKEKLAAFIVKVGYPDKWTDMSALHIDNSKSYVENIMQCARFWNAEHVRRKAGKPVDPTEWQMTP